MLSIYFCFLYKKKNWEYWWLKKVLNHVSFYFAWTDFIKSPILTWVAHHIITFWYQSPSSCKKISVNMLDRISREVSLLKSDPCVHLKQCHWVSFSLASSVFYFPESVIHGGEVSVFRYVIFSLASMTDPFVSLTNCWLMHLKCLCSKPNMVVNSQFYHIIF